MPTSGSIHRSRPARRAVLVVDSSALTAVPGARAASAAASARITVARCAGATCMPSCSQSPKLFVGSFMGLTAARRMAYAVRRWTATRARNAA